MIVLGADTHKRSHTVAAGTGELLGEQTVAVGRRGFGALLQWARGLDEDRVWALEDCRHVSGSLERFLIGRGERVLRIPTHLTAKARKSARQRGKSDPIDALNVARAALQEAWTRSRRRTWPGPNSTCGCSSTTANGWSHLLIGMESTRFTLLDRSRCPPIFTRSTALSWICPVAVGFGSLISFSKPCAMQSPMT
jgi:hypothetical protein